MIHSLFSFRSTVIAACACLLFLGVGCASSVSTPPASPDDGTASSNPVDEFAARRLTDAGQNTLPVAMVLTPGMDAPETGVLRFGEVIGCGDTIAFAQLSRETASANVAVDALRTLLAFRESSHAGLYNSLAHSSVQLDDMRSPDGVTMHVFLSGSLVSAGTCDTPRLKAQIEATVGQYWPAYAVFLNGSAEEWACFGNESGECL